MSSKIVSIALTSSFSLLAGLAFASEVTYPTNPERDPAVQAQPTALSRAQVRAELADYLGNPVSPDGWRDVGGERGSALVQHQYGYVNGHLTHTDHFDHNVAKPSLTASVAEKMLAKEQYRNSL